MAPVRSCIGCRRRRPADELVRLAWSEGAVRIGRTLPGRGAWLCPDEACRRSAVRRRALGRALRRDLPPHGIPEIPQNFHGSEPQRNGSQSV